MTSAESNLENAAASQACCDRLVAWFGNLCSCAVAYSGGVDSAVVAKAAHVALGENALAVTGVSASLASGELQAAKRLAQLIGIRHEVIHTQEFASRAYTQNAPDRCYHCKTELYARLEAATTTFRVDAVVNGANTDDLGDYRPGLQAAGENGVRSPLVECELDKQAVRALAAHWKLPVWDKPAAPCLSSRIAYGEEVTPERLAMVDCAEQYLRGLGLADVRVRYHQGDLARIEVSADQIARLTTESMRSEIHRKLTAGGFKFVSLDLQGFCSGSLNRLVELT